MSDSRPRDAIPTRFAWRDAPSPDAPRQLALYHYDSCPFCRRVMPAMDRLDAVRAEPVERRDVLLEPATRAELVRRTGRGTVPCLFIDGVALFESVEIMAWLDAHTAWHTAASSR